MECGNSGLGGGDWPGMGGPGRNGRPGPGNPPTPNPAGGWRQRLGNAGRIAGKGARIGGALAAGGYASYEAYNAASGLFDEKRGGLDKANDVSKLALQGSGGFLGATLGPLLGLNPVEGAAYGAAAGAGIHRGANAIGHSAPVAAATDQMMTGFGLWGDTPEEQFKKQEEKYKQHMEEFTQRRKVEADARKASELVSAGVVPKSGTVESAERELRIKEALKAEDEKSGEVKIEQAKDNPLRVVVTDEKGKPADIAPDITVNTAKGIVGFNPKTGDAGERREPPATGQQPPPEKVNPEKVKPAAAPVEMTAAQVKEALSNPTTPAPKIEDFEKPGVAPGTAMDQFNKAAVAWKQEQMSNWASKNNVSAGAVATPVTGGAAAVPRVAVAQQNAAVADTRNATNQANIPATRIPLTPQIAGTETPEGPKTPISTDTPNSAKELGAVSAKYEGNYGTVSSGKGDPGGVSYGRYQFASKAGGVQKFLASNPEYQKEFAGLEPGSPEFGAKWKELSKDPKFQAAQDDTAKSKWFDPAAAYAKKVGFKTDNLGVQQAIFSGSIQHGKFKEGVLAEAAKAPGFSDMSPEEQIKEMYSARSRYVDKLGMSNLKTRYEREQKDALANAGQPGPTVAKAEAQTKEKTTQPKKVIDKNAKPNFDDFKEPGQSDAIAEMKFQAANAAYQKRLDAQKATKTKDTTTFDDITAAGETVDPELRAQIEANKKSGTTTYDNRQSADYEDSLVGNTTKFMLHQGNAEATTSTARNQRRRGALEPTRQAYLNKSDAVESGAASRQKLMSKSQAGAGLDEETLRKQGVVEEKPENELRRKLDESTLKGLTPANETKPTLVSREVESNSSRIGGAALQASPIGNGFGDELQNATFEDKQNDIKLSAGDSPVVMPSPSTKNISTMDGMSGPQTGAIVPLTISNNESSIRRLTDMLLGYGFS